MGGVEGVVGLWRDVVVGVLGAVGLWWDCGVSRGNVDIILGPSLAPFPPAPHHPAPRVVRRALLCSLFGACRGETILLLFNFVPRSASGELKL